jgi:hypothetical protein
MNFNSVNNWHLVFQMLDLTEHVPQFSGIVVKITDIHDNTLWQEMSLTEHTKTMPLVSSWLLSFLTEILSVSISCVINCFRN